jgi:hypothetical protein
MATIPGVTIAVPQRVSASGPIRLRVTMIADMQTHYANNGILDKALNVLLVRRDAPGLRLVAKLDPHVIMLPDSPMPPPPPGTDFSRGGFIKEERELDVTGFGGRHDGTADYFVLASFASWISQPMPLSIETNYRRLPAGDAASLAALPSNEREKIPSPPSIRGLMARIKTEPELRVEGSLRMAIRPMRFEDDFEFFPFVSIIAAHLVPNGGISTGSFLLDPQKENADFVGQFSIPLNLLAPPPTPGKYQLLVFAGNEYSKPLDFLMP